MTIFQDPVNQSSSIILVLLFKKTEAICTASMLVHSHLITTAHESTLPTIYDLIKSENMYDDPNLDLSVFLTTSRQRRSLVQIA